MPKEILENDSKDFITDAKDTVDITLATDDYKKLKHKTSFKNQ
jgi:hypothetical protein